MKFRTGLMLGAAAMTGLALTFHPGHNNGVGFVATPALAENAAPDASPTSNHAETYRLLTLFGTVLDLVRADYV
ncbi:MAG: peptidase S41, partial [Acetobacter syzygii]